MSKAVSGKRIIYLYRLLKEAGTASATQVAFVSENGRTKSKDADSTATKDGAIRTPGSAEVEITATSVMADDDVMINKLEDAMDADDLIEIWEVNLDRPIPPTSGTTPTGKYEGTYFQGYLTEVECTSNAEDNVELSLTFGINGSGVRGEVTVSDEQQEIAKYVFKDTVPENNGGSGGYGGDD